MDNTRMIRNTDSVFTNGLTAELTLEIGLKVNKLILEFIFYQMETPEEVFGKTVQGNHGSI